MKAPAVKIAGVFYLGSRHRENEMKTLLIRVVTAALAMAGVAAVAGEQLAREVTYDAIKPFVSGDLGYVRNTPDTVQYLGCFINGASAICQARNSAGLAKSCITTDPDKVNALRSLNGDSRLAFGWNADGTCSSIIVYNDSRYPTK
jgi:hypothetical protein